MEKLRDCHRDDCTCYFCSELRKYYKMSEEESMPIPTLDKIDIEVLRLARKYSNGDEEFRKELVAGMYTAVIKKTEEFGDSYAFGAARARGRNMRKEKWECSNAEQRKPG